jgi:hypothetical protein
MLFEEPEPLLSGGKWGRSTKQDRLEREYAFSFLRKLHSQFYEFGHDEMSV